MAWILKIVYFRSNIFLYLNTAFLVLHLCINIHKIVCLYICIISHKSENRVSPPFVNNHSFPCEQMSRRVFTTYRSSYEQPSKRMFTRRAAVVHKRKWHYHFSPSPLVWICKILLYSEECRIHKIGNSGDAGFITRWCPKRLLYLSLFANILLFLCSENSFIPCFSSTLSKKPVIFAPFPEIFPIFALVYACSDMQRQLTLWENIAFAVILYRSET